MNKQVISFVLNGEQRELEIEPNELLMNVLRERENLTGTKYRCGIGECGACTVHMNGNPVRSCQIPAAAASGARARAAAPTRWRASCRVWSPRTT